MAKAKLGIDGKNATQIVAYSSTLIATIAEPASALIYATPEPSVADFNLTHNALAAGVNLIATLESQLEAARADLPQLQKDHEDNIRLRASYVDDVSGGDPTKIPLGGFAVVATPQPVGPLPAPEGMKAVMSNFPGVIKTSCDVVEGTRSYLTQCREHVDGTAWVQCSAGPRKSDNGGLTSGKVYAFRMAALGTAGQSPWSPETTCMAP